MADDNKQDVSPDTNHVSNKFAGIPIAELVAAPLVAVCESQKKLAQSAYEFMTEIGFNDEGKTRMVEFNPEKPIEESDSEGSTRANVNSPEDARSTEQILK